MKIIGMKLIDIEKTICPLCKKEAIFIRFDVIKKLFSNILIATLCFNEKCNSIGCDYLSLAMFLYIKDNINEPKLKILKKYKNEFENIYLKMSIFP